MVTGRRGQSPKRGNPAFVDFKSYAPDQYKACNVLLPALGFLVCRGTKRDERLRDPMGDGLSGLFFSKVGGWREVSRLLQIGVLRPAQARYAALAIARSKLPETDSSHVTRLRLLLLPSVPKTVELGRPIRLVPVPRPEWSAELAATG